MVEHPDISLLKQALDLAHIRRGFCSPNPSVGAIIVNSTNHIISTGYHVGCGEAHAEVDALKSISTESDAHTLYVTLEPCCHWGKTPPCTDAIIKAGLKRVVYGFKDPNPKVSGQGAAQLITAGIACDYVPCAEIDEFYESYHHWQNTKRPFVTAKIALTLDGKIAGKNGEPIHITGDALQALTHASRKASDAILSTAKTIICDDPQLNVRIDKNTISKPLYLLDSKLSLPLSARIFQTANNITIFHSEHADMKRKESLIHQGVRCIAVSSNDEGLDLNKIVDHIGQDGVHDLWVEAGGECFSALIEKKLAQCAYIYVATRWLGEGQPAFKKDFSLNSDAKKIKWQQKGDDVFCQIHW